MRGVHPLVACIVFLICCLSPLSRAQAVWLENGVPVSSYNSGNIQPSALADGEGGAFVAWGDGRSGPQDIYAQRLDAWGRPRWTPEGVLVVSSPGYQMYPALVTDGAGGAIIVWLHYSSPTYDIYAQRIDGNGNILWPSGGVPVCVDSKEQQWFVTTSDGFGGVIISWLTYDTSGTPNYDIYAQRLNGSGTALWTPNGVVLPGGITNQETPSIAATGTGGAIIAFEQPSPTSAYDVFAVGVTASGSITWYTVLSALNGDQGPPIACADGAGGAVVTWVDSGPLNAQGDIIAQRLNYDGALRWGSSGKIVCGNTSDQDSPVIACDELGGSFIAWTDYRNGNDDIYAQYLDSSGDPRWTTNGNPVCTDASSQRYANVMVWGHLYSDGGCFVTWEDSRDGGYRSIYAQKLYHDGGEQWETDGTAVVRSTVYDWEMGLGKVVSDGSHGIIATWNDYRASRHAAYAQRVERHGYWGFPSPYITDVTDVPGDQGGSVALAWQASRFDAEHLVGFYSIWRSISGPDAATLVESGTRPLTLADIGADFKGPGYLFTSLGGATYAWEWIENAYGEQDPSYSLVVPTLYDSVGSNPGYHHFFVSAHYTDFEGTFWDSPPDSGYSVDNLAPGTPSGLAGRQQFSPPGLELTWHRSAAADFAKYTVYRGTVPGFTPAPGNRIASPLDTACVDLEWTPASGYYYKVSTLDIHGNESGYASLGPGDVTGIDSPGIPFVSHLAQNFPNPFNPSTTIRFSIETGGHLSLTIFDPVGRVVRRLLDTHRDAGPHEVFWDGKDDRGEPVASGVYLYRLRAGSFAGTRKMIVVR